MAENRELMTIDNICNRVYFIRGQQVMLDCDLAEIYGYEVKRLNEQVKRNITRFPEDFMFQLTKDEIPENFLKSQIATLNENGNKRGLHIKKLPFAFTEQGIYMLATVLRGELAEQQSIFIMRAFREMRHYIKQNQQFVTQSEMRLVTAKVSEISVQIAGVVDWKNKAEDRFDSIQRSIDTLNENFVSDKDFKNFVIYKGQKFEADAAYIDIYQQAKKSIYVVDDYVNTKTLQLLSQKHAGVEVVLFTENGHGKRGFLTTSVVNDFIQEYPPLRIKPNADCHDRLIVLDYGFPTEQAYHCGASSKDAGKKLCAINVILETNMIHPVIDKLLFAPDKQI
ncbi:MAG: ORF6N domain-containing protein [Lachnospiraceae bacterium]|nr:ORF6N domain-containing protein [Lachnospiraceae bacterium]